MPKPKLTAENYNHFSPEVDNFFLNKEAVEKENTSNQKDISEQNSEKAELQNPAIVQIQSENAEVKTLPAKESKKKQLSKKDDPKYMRVTVPMKKSTVKKIKDFMWSNEIKRFEDGLEYFLSDKPLK